MITADCTIEINAFSAYREKCHQNKHPWQDGYVTLDGVKVWNGSWCGNSPHNRGVIILVIDPLTCTKKESHTFDTYDTAREAALLCDQLQKIKKGSIIGEYYTHTVKLLINVGLITPAFNRDLAFIGDSASIRTLALRPLRSLLLGPLFVHVLC